MTRFEFEFPFPEAGDTGQLGISGLKFQVSGKVNKNYLLFKDDGPVVWREQKLLQEVPQPVINLEKNKKVNAVLL